MWLNTNINPLQQMAWETVSLMRGELYTEVPIVFENIKFMRATNVPKDGKKIVTCSIPTSKI